MRLVQVPIPPGKRDAVLAALDDEGIDYLLTDETSGRKYTAVVTFPVPTAAVEPVLERLREIGIERDAYTVVLDAETVVSKQMDVLEERYENGEDSDKIAREELRSKAEDLSPSFPTYVTLTTVSVVIATAGVLLDSPAIVVGSMVIAPLIGPAMATSVGTVLDDRDLFRRGLRLQVVGFGLAVVTASAFAWLVRTGLVVPPGLDVLTIPEVNRRIQPDFLSLVIAIGAGIAGAMSLRADVSASLVGVMIAVALVPPVAVMGVGIAWGLPAVVVGSGVLVLLNVLSINLAALATLWYSGYRPAQWLHRERTRVATLRQIVVLAVVIVVLSAFLGGITLAGYRQAVTETAINDEVGTVLDAPEYEDVETLEVDVRFESLEQWLFDDPFSPGVESVVVTVGSPEGRGYPDLADRIADRVDAPIEVRFVAVDRAGREPDRSSRVTDATSPLFPDRLHPSTPLPHPARGR